MSAPTKRQIQFVRSLQSRKSRDDQGLFVAEGPKVVAELLAAQNLQIQEVFASPAWAAEHGSQVQRAGGAIIETGDQALSRMTSLAGPNQVIAVFSKPRFPDSHAPNADRLTVVLDGVQDPGNVGTIVRCADWFGVKQVVCGPGSADVFNTKVVQSSMGSIARVRVDYVADLVEHIDAFHADVPVFVASLAGENMHEVAAPDRVVLVIGSESHGVSAHVCERGTRQVTISRRGQAESLNAAVAAGILMEWCTKD